MPDHMIVYASTSRIAPAYAEREMRELVAQARERNATMGVTGALLHGEQRFAQALEGERAAVTAIMDSIRRDPRHSNIVMLYDEGVSRRRFASWSLAFSPDARFIDQAIMHSVYEANLATRKALGEMLHLMLAFTASLDPAVA